MLKFLWLHNQRTIKYDIVYIILYSLLISITRTWKWKSMHLIGIHKHTLDEPPHKITVNHSFDLSEFFAHLCNHILTPAQGQFAETGAYVMQSSCVHSFVIQMPKKCHAFKPNQIHLP